MKEYLSYFSAAAMWNIPYIETVLDTKLAEADLIDITVTQRNARSQRKGYNIFLSELALPASAVVSKNGQMVASPELVFLQFASKLHIHRLILLGLQLCSYSPGKPSEAITTKHKLKSFLMKTSSGHRGHIIASRAVKYLEDGSASIMESIVYMILTLPHAMGGYGLGDVVFNYEIKLSDDAGKRLGQKRCFLDMYYKSVKLAIEYDSFAFHNTPLMQGKDSMRSASLERQGIDIMHMSTIQLYDKGACMDFAFNLASRLGKRIQIRTKKFNDMHEHLRSLLPIAESATGPDGPEGVEQ
ncbi:MAG: hypothetical protein GX815_01750 [Clostridiales bacterium]|nr:hypothetical protein [Clostridiales bacterium]